jgi:hypothetical protein
MWREREEERKKKKKREMSGLENGKYWGVLYSPDLTEKSLL